LENILSSRYAVLYIVDYLIGFDTFSIVRS